jgi:CHAT domain
MRTITLSIVGAQPGVLRLSVDGEGGQATVDVEAPLEETVKSLRANPSRLEGFLTPILVRALRQWAMNEPGTSVLVVACELDQLDGLPWEHLPQVLEIRSVCVVRQVRQKPIPHSRPKEEPVLLAAGWSGTPKFQLPGIMEELRALGSLCAAAGRPAHVLSDPTLEELTIACNSFKPDILHLVPPAIDTLSETPRVVLSGTDDIQFVEADRFLSILPKNLHPHLVVVNSCSSGAGKQGSSLTRMIVERWSTIAIGWLGIVQDLAAADFTRFLYSRLLEGHPLSEVIRAYGLLESSSRNVEQPSRDVALARIVTKYRPAPVIWTRDVAAVAEPVFPLRTPSADLSGPSEGLDRASGGHVTRGSSAAKPKTKPSPGRKQTEAEPTEVGSPRLELDFEPQSWLNPALLKNGRPAITRLVLDPDRSLRNVELSITCDTGNGFSAVRQTIDLGRGPQPVSTEDRQFPALYELIEAGVPRRQINFTVTCKWEGRLLAERTIPVLWMGRAEWLDQKENWHYVPAFVNPYDDGVLDVLDKADGTLKTIAGPTSSFSGYQTGDGDHVMKQVEALFNCLRTEYQLNYITPPPISVFLPGALQSSGQRVRRPEEVIKRRRGTCHDLAVLLASCMEHIGINPIVYLIRGHTFVGFWKSDADYALFWQVARNQKLRLPQVPGREWIMTDLKEVQELVDQKSIVSVEATKVTNRNATFAEAIKEGSKRWQDKRLETQPFDVAIDIRASRYLVQPL